MRLNARKPKIHTTHCQLNIIRCIHLILTMSFEIHTVSLLQFLLCVVDTCIIYQTGHVCTHLGPVYNVMIYKLFLEVNAFHYTACLTTVFNFPSTRAPLPPLFLSFFLFHIRQAFLCRIFSELLLVLIWMILVRQRRRLRQPAMK